MPTLSKSKKQDEYIRGATHRWNIKTGATRSGKSFLDVAYIIPRRIMDVRDKRGLIVFLGNTKGTLQRNVIQPMQEIFGTNRVSDIRSDNTASVFGKRVYCLGADNKKHVERVQGSAFSYAYGDEITTWDEGVFEMLKSRLDKPWSKFDGTANPAAPSHWLKRFLDSDADIFQQSYTIDDNPFLDDGFVYQLKKEYAGTIYYNRFILGQWCAAEGVIYKLFADNPQRYITQTAPSIMQANIGVDFGGGRSAHAFSCVGYTNNFKEMVVLDEYRNTSAMTPEKLCEVFVDFLKRCRSRWIVADVFCDSAEQTLINGLRVATARAGIGVNILNARKRPINDRIRALGILLGSDRFKIMSTCTETINALQTAVWDDKRMTEDVRLDNGTSNIDSLDAMEYAYENDISTLIETW